MTWLILLVKKLRTWQWMAYGIIRKIRPRCTRPHCSSPVTQNALTILLHWPNLTRREAKRLWRWIDEIRYQGSPGKLSDGFGRHHRFYETNGLNHLVFGPAKDKSLCIYCPPEWPQAWTNHRDGTVSINGRNWRFKILLLRHLNRERNQLGSIFAMVFKVLQVFVQTGAVHYPTRLACCDTFAFCSMFFPPLP